MNGQLTMVSIDQVHESPMNVRRHFNPAAQTELIESIRAHGVLTPLLVRPNDNGYEIGAGHRRYRAAQAAELVEVPVLVREMDDQAFMELVVIDNLQREDINPLEEGDGFKRLMTFGFDIDRLAARIGKSRKYIYDRVKLLDLIDPARALLLEDRITAGHAILLARLSPAQQTEALKVEKRNGWGGRECALFQEEQALLDDFDKDQERQAAKKSGDLYHGMKVRSVRELDAWIAQHVRFEPLAAVNQELFPATIRAVEQAEKVVSITHNHHVNPDAKEGNDERIYGPMSWKNADPREDSKPCDRSVTGVIVVGPGRGEAFKVCVHKDCDVHWAKEKRAKAKAEKSTATATNYKQQRDAQEARWKREAEEREARQRAFESARPALYEAMAKQVRSCPVAKVIALLIDELLDPSHIKAAMKLLDLKAAVPEEALRVLCLGRLVQMAANSYRADDLAKTVKPLGVDVATLLKKVQSSAMTTSEKAAAKAVTKKKPATKAKAPTRKKKP